MRKRFSVKNPSQVTGYSVALPGGTTKDGGPVWYGGGKLAPDLSWPKLRRRWTQHRATPGRPHLTAEDRNAAPGTTPHGSPPTPPRRSVTWPGPTRLPPLMPPGPPPTPCTWLPPCSAAASCARPPTPTTAARAPYGHIPPPAPAGNRLRHAARLLSAFTYLTGDRSIASIVLLTKLAALAEAVAELRDAQQHAAQAAAARAAAERLYAAARPAPAQPRPAPRASTAAQLAGLSFPQPARPAPQPAAPGQPGPDQGGSSPARRPSPPRPRGPSR